MREAGEPLERVGDPLCLGRELRVVGEVLEAAAAAGRVVRAGRVDALRPRPEDLDGERLRVAALHLRHPRPDRVAGEAAADEDDESVQPRDAVPAVGERVDRQLELLVALDRCGHGVRLRRGAR